jgi:hypothetical protein
MRIKIIKSKLKTSKNTCKMIRQIAPENYRVTK